MSNNRREFLKSLSKKTVVATAAVAAPALAYKDDMLEELSKAASAFNDKLNKTSALLTGNIKSLSNRLEGAVATLAYQQYQLNLIFLLLVISFVIDGGMSLYAWQN